MFIYLNIWHSGSPSKIKIMGHSSRLQEENVLFRLNVKVNLGKPATTQYKLRWAKMVEKRT